MPQLITNKSEKQLHPLYPNERERAFSGSGKRADSPEQMTAVPKTYDAIESAAGPDMKPTGTEGRMC